MHDEELGACGIRSGCPCHGEDAGRVAERVFEPVLGKFAADAVAGAARAGTGGVAALNHEAADDAVEDQAVIEAFIDQADEVVDGLRGEVGIELRRDHIAVFHGDRYQRIDCFHCIRFLSVRVFLYYLRYRVIGSL